MRCIIVEDQPPAQRILKTYIADLGTLELVGTFSDALQAMDLLHTEEIDLIFLDIHLPKISGFEFLRSLVRPPHIILTTAFPDYALESYEFNVVDYLLKPFSFQRFVKAIAKIPAQIEKAPAAEGKRKEVFIKSGYDHIKLNLDDILFIKSDADYTELMLPQKKYLTSEPLRHWISELDENQFYRVHKSYIVNITKIAKVAGNKITLVDGRDVPIGRTYKDAFVERFIK